MHDKQIVVLGAKGLLGSHLVPILEERNCWVSTPTKEEWDISKVKHIPHYLYGWRPDIIVNCAAYTDVSKAEQDKWEAIQTNIIGCENLVKIARQLKSKVIQISSDYANVRPMGFYAFTKYAGEVFFQNDEDLVIRTSFKKRGTWDSKSGYSKVIHPIHTCSDWVDIIAPKIVDAILEDKKGTHFIGTEKKTLRDLAVQENPNIENMSPEDADRINGYVYPRDCTKF